MIKATVITENDSVQTEVDADGKCTALLIELAALNATVIKQLRENFPTLNVNGVLEVLNGMTKAGLDIFKEESENV